MIEIPAIDGMPQGQPPENAIHILNYGDRLVYLLPGEEDLIPQPPAATEPPNWLEFRLGMLTDPHYSQIAVSAQASAEGRLTLQRLEMAISFTDPFLPLVSQLWDRLFLSVNYQPTSEAISSWRRIALNSHMAFGFDDVGRIVA